MLRITSGFVLAKKNVLGLGAVQCEWRVRFSSGISVQTRWSRKDVRDSVYLVQLNVNNEEIRL